MGPIRIHVRPSFRLGLLLVAALGAWRSTVVTTTGAAVAAADPTALSRVADEPPSNPASDRIAHLVDDDRVAAGGDLAEELDDDGGDDDAIGARAIVLWVFAPASPACVPARGERPSVVRDALFRPPRASV